MDIEALRRGAESPSQAGKAELSAVAAALSDAFADDVRFDWFLRPDAKADGVMGDLFGDRVHVVLIVDGNDENHEISAKTRLQRKQGHAHVLTSGFVRGPARKAPVGYSDYSAACLKSLSQL